MKSPNSSTSMQSAMTDGEHPTVPFLRRPRVTAAIVALFLVVTAVLQFRDIPNSVPAPLVALLDALFGYTPELAGRLLSSSTLAGALIVLFFGVGFGNRFLPTVAASLGAFVSLACISRALSAGGMGYPATSFVVFTACSVLSMRSIAINRMGRRGLSPAWTALSAIAIATITGAVAARETDPSRPSESAPKVSIPKVVNVDFDMHPFVGRRVEETPIGASLPSLAARTRGVTTFVVFYMPDCSACHSLFDQFFSAPRLEQVLTVEIPPANGVPQVESGEAHEPIVCVGCEPLLLPPGPNYLVASPMVIKIEDGVVTCVSDRFKGECLLAP